jgi:PAS domain S-box-containing protein
MIVYGRFYWQMSEDVSYGEWRCDCGRLLFKGVLMVGVMETKCSRCKRMVYIQQFESVTTSEPSLFMLLSLDGEIMAVSNSVREVFGYSRESTIGKCLADFLNSNTRLVMWFWIKKIGRKSPEDSAPFTSRMEIKHFDGHWIPVTFFARVMDYQSRRVIFGVAELGNEPIARYVSRELTQGNSREMIQADIWDLTIDRSQIIRVVSGKNQLGLDDSSLGGCIFDYIPEQGSFNIKNISRVMNRGDNYVDHITIGYGNDTQTFEISLTTDLYTTDRRDEYLVSLIKI